MRLLRGSSTSRNFSPASLTASAARRCACCHGIKSSLAPKAIVVALVFASIYLAIGDGSHDVFCERLPQMQMSSGWNSWTHGIGIGKTAE